MKREIQTPRRGRAPTERRDATFSRAHDSSRRDFQSESESSASRIRFYMRLMIEFAMNFGTKVMVMLLIVFFS